MASKKKQKSQKRQTTLPPIKVTKSTEVEYRNALLAYLNKMKKFVETKIYPLLEKNEEEYVRDSLNSDLKKRLNEFEKLFVKNDVFAFGVSTKFMNKIKSDNDRRFAETSKDKIGVDIFNKNSRRLQQIVQSKINENVNLIKTQSQKYFGDISNAVYEGISNGTRASSIQKAITEKTGQMNRHLKFIAIDQTYKANAAITEEKQRDIGVEEYIWRTTGTIKVRGNPNGLYPNAKPSHWAREGKKFRWNKPPEGGHPGQDYHCMCYAEAIIPDEVIEQNV